MQKNKRKKQGNRIKNIFQKHFLHPTHNLFRGRDGDVTGT